MRSLEIENDWWRPPELARARVVYLDQNIVSMLTARSDYRWRKAYGLLLELVGRGRIVCPASPSHLKESAQATHSGEAILSTLRELSGGWCYGNNWEIRFAEFLPRLAAYLNVPFSGNFHSLGVLVHVASPQGLPERFGVDVQNSLRSATLRLLDLLPTPLRGSEFSELLPHEESFAFEENLIRLLRSGNWDAVTPFPAKDLALPAFEFIRQHGHDRATALQVLEWALTHEPHTSCPSRKLQARLWAEMRRRNGDGRAWKGSDLEDLVFASSQVLYSDAAVLERGLTDLLTNSPARLARPAIFSTGTFDEFLARIESDDFVS